MGGGSSKNDYKAENDPAPFFNEDTHSEPIPIDYKPGAGEYEYFAKNFGFFFPPPDSPVRELCETVKHYEDVQWGILAYSGWMMQLYLHIKKGYRVGIPYLANAPKMVGGKNVMIPQMPPLRWRHLQHYQEDGKGWYIGTLAIYRAIQTQIGEFASDDSINKYFDVMIKERPNTQEGQNKMDAFMMIAKRIYNEKLQQANWHEREPRLNADQAQESNAPLLLDYSGNDHVSKIQSCWGLKGSMHVAFPTMWYRYKDDIYGDGRETDSEMAIFGFPRLHKDFFTNDKGFVCSPAFFGGLTSLFNQPPAAMLANSKLFISKFGFQESYWCKNPLSARFKEAHAWMVAENRWNDMRGWIMTNFPNMLAFYVEWPSSGNHTSFLNVMGLLIYGRVSYWMNSAIGKNNEMIWKDKLIPYVPGHDTGDVWGGKDHGGDAQEIGFIAKNTNDKGQVTSTIEKKPDGTRVAISFNPDTGKKIAIERIDKDLKPITNIKIDWDYPISIERPFVMLSDSMNKIRDLWKQSHLGILGGSGIDWVEQGIPSSPNLAIPPKDMTTLPDAEYIKHVFNFMRNNPLPKPTTPSIFQESWLSKTFHYVYSLEDGQDDWNVACNKQWNFYLIWVEANVNAQGKEGYVRPGKVIGSNSTGSEIFNSVPDTGILDSAYRNVGGDRNVKLIHIAFLGLTTIFGDQWWKDIINFLSDTFDLVIELLRKLTDFVIQHAGGIAIIAAVILGGVFLFSLVGDEAKKLVG